MQPNLVHITICPSLSGCLLRRDWKPIAAANLVACPGNAEPRHTPLEIAPFDSGLQNLDATRGQRHAQILRETQQTRPEVTLLPFRQE